MVKDDVTTKVLKSLIQTSVSNDAMLGAKKKLLDHPPGFESKTEITIVDIADSDVGVNAGKSDSSVRTDGKVTKESLKSERFYVAPGYRKSLDGPASPRQKNPRENSGPIQTVPKKGSEKRNENTKKKSPSLTQMKMPLVAAVESPTAEEVLAINENNDHPRHRVILRFKKISSTPLMKTRLLSDSAKAAIIKNSTNESTAKNAQPQRRIKNRDAKIGKNSNADKVESEVLPIEENLAKRVLQSRGGSHKEAPSCDEVQYLKSKVISREEESKRQIEDKMKFIPLITKQKKPPTQEALLNLDKNIVAVKQSVGSSKKPTKKKSKSPKMGGASKKAPKKSYLPDEDLLAAIPLPPLPTVDLGSCNWEEMFDRDTIEDPYLQHQRNYASKFLENSVGMKEFAQAPKGKVVIDPQVMLEYGQVCNQQQFYTQPKMEAKPQFKVITMVEGDVFDSKAALAHCVSEDLRMSSGIAVVFRRRFGHVAELLNQRKRPGETAALRHGNRFIYYLVTKEFFLAKPEGISILKRCLMDMREHCLENNVKEVSMPKIGCGRDHLQWSQVSVAIEQVFANSGIRINIYHFQEQPMMMNSWPRKRPAQFPMFIPPLPPKMSKVDWMPDPQDLPTMKPVVVHHQFNQNIMQLRPPIARIFLTSVEPSQPEGAAILINESYKIWQDLMSRYDRVLGTCIPLFAGQVYCLVCREKPTDPIDYVALHRAAKELARATFTIGTQRLGLQGFTLPDDRVATIKVCSLLRLALVNQPLSLSVAWPEEAPYEKLIRYSQQGPIVQQNVPTATSPQLGPGEYDY